MGSMRPCSKNHNQKEEEEEGGRKGIGEGQEEGMVTVTSWGVSVPS